MVDDWPFALVYAVFFAGAVVRANATYWLGRGARRGGERTRGARHLDSPLVQRAERLVSRFGAPAVTLSFLTVGVQSAINFAAGVLRMPLVAYEAGVAFGALAWAGIYSTIGFAVVEAWFGELSWGWVLAAAFAGLVVVLLTRQVRRRLGVAAPLAESAADRDQT